MASSTAGQDAPCRLLFTVVGIPVGQGSKRAFANRRTGQPIIVDDNQARLRPWREAVAYRARWALEAAEIGEQTPFVAGIRVELGFSFPRPAGHYRPDGRSLRPSAPAVMATRPDVDKLTRAVLDSLKDANVYRNDAQVIELTARKGYGAPGLQVLIEEAS